MQDVLTFRDVIKKSVLEAGGFLQETSGSTLLRAFMLIMLSLLVGLALYWLYKRTYAGVVYSHSFAVSITAMCVLTCSIIVAIQSNVVLSLGMVGALSIVRYRTAVKDPMDLVFLFWAVAVGIAIGAGMFYIALIVLAVMGGLLLFLKRRHGGDEMYILLVHYTGDSIDAEIRRAMGILPYQIKSKTLRKLNTEMAIEVRVKKHDLSFVDKIRQNENISDITLVQYNGDYID